MVGHYVIRFVDDPGPTKMVSLAAMYTTPVDFVCGSTDSWGGSKKDRSGFCGSTKERSGFCCDGYNSWGGLIRRRRSDRGGFNSGSYAARLFVGHRSSVYFCFGVMTAIGEDGYTQNCRSKRLHPHWSDHTTCYQTAPSTAGNSRFC